MHILLPMVVGVYLSSIIGFLEPTCIYGPSGFHCAKASTYFHYYQIVSHILQRFANRNLAEASALYARVKPNLAQNATCCSTDRQAQGFLPLRYRAALSDRTCMFITVNNIVHCKGNRFRIKQLCMIKIQRPKSDQPRLDERLLLPVPKS